MAIMRAMVRGIAEETTVMKTPSLLLAAHRRASDNCFEKMILAAASSQKPVAGSVICAVAGALL